MDKFLMTDHLHKLMAYLFYTYYFLYEIQYVSHCQYSMVCVPGRTAQGSDTQIWYIHLLYG